MRKFKLDLLLGSIILIVAVAAIVVTAGSRGTADTNMSTVTTEIVTETTEEVVETMEVVETTITTEPTEVETTVVTEPVVLETQAAIEHYELDSLMCDTSDELEMLACVIYQEAGGNGSCEMCRYRVADVVLNRIESGYWGDTMLGVLTAKRQYGRFHWTGVRWSDRAKHPSEAAAVNRAYAVAQDVLNGNHSDLYGEGYIWQAEFVQGKSGFWCCGTYFGKS